MEIDMDPVVIEDGSEAFEYLRAVMTDPRTYKVSLDVRSDGVAVKQNEYMWTATMETAKR
jgi:hypothetical protein